MSLKELFFKKREDPDNRYMTIYLSNSLQTKEDRDEWMKSFLGIMKNDYPDDLQHLVSNGIIEEEVAHSKADKKDGRYGIVVDYVGRIIGMVYHPLGDRTDEEMLGILRAPVDPSPHDKAKIREIEGRNR